MLDRAFAGGVYSDTVRRLSIAVVVGVSLMVASSSFARGTLTLTLRGGHSGAPGSACGVHPAWRYYSRGSTVIFSGRIVAPTGAMVRVVVKRCYGSVFRVIETQRLSVHDGKFGNTFVVHARSDCFVQATYSGMSSPRAYFRVR
jgi:hypothetical protein